MVWPANGAQEERRGHDSDTGSRERPFHRNFTLSITKALGDQLAAGLEELTPAPLADEHIDQLEERAGVYQLYLNGDFVYVGKADKSLQARLRNHLKKISGRRGITLDEITFSCLYVAEDFSALAPEQLLINHHKGQGTSPGTTTASVTGTQDVSVTTPS